LLVLLLSIRVRAALRKFILELLLNRHYFVIKRVVVGLSVVQACIIASRASGLSTTYVDLVLLHLLLLLDY
jgi:uncharacterized membrane protein YecN with MAPEG domain